MSVTIEARAGANTTAPAPKKSVALSGVPAGNTALCTVGRSGNDLHYRGYDILEIATRCKFEEVAYLLIHGKLPNHAELAAYRAKLKTLRGAAGRCAAGARSAAGGLSSDGRLAHRGVGAGLRAAGERRPQRRRRPGHRRSADRLARLDAGLLVSLSVTTAAASTLETDDDSIGGHFLHLLHQRRPPQSWVRAMHTSLILYAEHEFNASTFTARVIAGTGSDIYSCITGAIGALRGPKHGGANEVAFEIQKRYDTPDEAEQDIRARVANKEVIIGFGHPGLHDRRPAQRGDQGGRARLSREAGDTEMFDIAERIETVMREQRRCSRISTGSPPSPIT